MSALGDSTKADEIRKALGNKATWVDHLIIDIVEVTQWHRSLSSLIFIVKGSVDGAGMAWGNTHSFVDPLCVLGAVLSPG